MKLAEKPKRPIVSRCPNEAFKRELWETSRGSSYLHGLMMEFKMSKDKLGSSDDLCVQPSPHLTATNF